MLWGCSLNPRLLFCTFIVWSLSGSSHRLYFVSLLLSPTITFLLNGSVSFRMFISFCIMYLGQWPQYGYINKARIRHLDTNLRTSHISGLRVTNDRTLYPAEDYNKPTLSRHPSLPLALMRSEDWNENEIDNPRVQTMSFKLIALRIPLINPIHYVVLGEV